MSRIKHFMEDLKFFLSGSHNNGNIQDEKHFNKLESTSKPNQCTGCIYRESCKRSPSSDCMYVFEEEHFPIKSSFR